MLKTYACPVATISNNVPASRAGSNDASGTVRVAATNVSIYNLNIENTYGFVSSFTFEWSTQTS